MTSNRSKYLWSPFSDNFWIILCPLVALALMHGVWLWSGLSDTEVYAILFAFVVTGHHMPGWLRAFGEPTIYNEHKAKLWVSFLAVPALILLPTYYGLGFAALVVAATFDLWHVAMQQHGFGRIYGAKDGDTATQSARVDLACVLVWYATVVFWSDSWTYGIASSFRSAGLPIFTAMTPAGWMIIKMALLVVSAMLLLTYVIQAIRLWKIDRKVATRKHMLHAVAFGVLAFSYQDPNWYRAQSVQNLFHALQYFFIVWAFSYLSIKKNPDRPGVLYRALFRFRWGLLLYAAAIALYGWGGWSLDAYSQRFPGQESASSIVQVLGSIGLVSLLLHFYVDSFIWKVRTKHVQQALDIDGRGAPAGPSRHLRGAAHGIAYFGVPVLLILVAGQFRNRTASIEALKHEAELYPRSAQARFLYGVHAFEQRNAKIARQELSAALALAPTKQGPAILLAQLDAMEGRKELELVHIRAAVRAAPHSVNGHRALAAALTKRGQIDESVDVLLKLADLHRAHFGEPEKAVPVLQQVLRLDPANSAGACHLARVRVQLGQTGLAAEELAAHLSRNPTDAAARKLADQLAREE